MILPLMASRDMVNDPLIQLLMVLRTLRVFKVYRLIFFAADGEILFVFFFPVSLDELFRFCFWFCLFSFFVFVFCFVFLLRAAVKRRLVSLIVTFVILVFLSAAVVCELERYFASSPSKPNLVNFHDSVYFMVTSFTTVGYGDVVPTQTVSRVVMMILLVFYMVMLPVQVTSLARTIESTNQSDRAIYVKDRKHPFFVLMGNVTYDSVVSFLRELFNNTFYDKTIHVVILSEEAPSNQFHDLLRNSLFQGRVFFLTGNPLAPDALLRAKVHLARACVLLRGTGSSKKVSIESEDHRILMLAVGLKKLFPAVPLFAQVMSNMEKDAVITQLCDRLFCIHELNMSLMARSCIAPGAATLLANMFRSYAPPTIKNVTATWLAEYRKSQKQPKTN